MKTLKKTIVGTAEAKTSVIKKLANPLNVNFPIHKDTDLSDFEIRISKQDDKLVAKLFLKGLPVTQQTLPIRKVPNPPPVPNFDLIKALEQLRLNLKVIK